MSCNLHAQTRPRTRWAILVWVGVLSVLLAACGGAPQAKTHTIGVVNYVPFLDPVLDGFKARMAELGYVEGTNVTYIYHGATAPDPQAIDTEVKILMDQKVDMFLTLGTPTTLSAKKAVAGTDIPVVFAPVINPVEEGAVASINHPGGNVTGVQFTNDIPKALEWLLKLAPGTKTVYVPYNPKDEVSLTTIKPLPAAATQLGVKLVLDEVSTPEEAMAAIKTLPKDAAVLIIPMPSLEPLGTSAIRKLIMERGIPAGAYSNTPEELLFFYGADFGAQGKQAARLADQIFKGTKPADLPVETAEFFLRINLRTAKAIGLDIPDTTLALANTVIR